MIKRTILLAATLAFLFAGTQSLQAQDPTCGYGAGLGWGFSGGYFQGYSGINHKRVPYFALYPPVYYGEKVARPYGYSPFATPPAMMPAEMIALPQAEFKEIANPYFKSKPPAEPQVKTASDVGHNDKTT